MIDTRALRGCAIYTRSSGLSAIAEDLDNAANEIDALHARIAEVETALKIYANHDNWWCAYEEGWVEDTFNKCGEMGGYEIAEKALGTTPNDV